MILISAALAGALHLGWPAISLPHVIQIPSEGMRRRAGYKVRTKAYHLDGWEMRIVRDGFTGQVRCLLYARSDLTQGRMSYAQGVVGFHLGSSHDAAEAWYSLDDRPPQPWRNDYPVLVAHRVSLEGGSLANPTGGVVLVPEGKLIDVRTVTIRAKADSTPKRFQLKGFQQALSAARLNGCTSFERDPW